MKRSAVLLVVVTIMLGLGACSSKSISKPDYLVKANAICKATTTKLTPAEKKLSSEAEAEKFITSTYLPAIHGDIAAIEKLGYPKGDKATLQSIFDDTDALITKISSNPKKYVAGNDPFTAIDKRLTTYGLKSCGTSSS